MVDSSPLCPKSPPNKVSCWQRRANNIWVTENFQHTPLFTGTQSSVWGDTADCLHGSYQSYHEKKEFSKNKAFHRFVNNQCIPTASQVHSDLESPILILGSLKGNLCPYNILCCMHFHLRQICGVHVRSLSWQLRDACNLTWPLSLQFCHVLSIYM